MCFCMLSLFVFVGFLCVFLYAFFVCFCMLSLCVYSCHFVRAFLSSNVY